MRAGSNEAGVSGQVVSVVVCDDDGVLRTAVTTICQAAGLQVVAETDSGAAALELVQRFGVDVLVLDQSLPDMSGERVLESLRELPSRPEVVVFSAYATEPYHLIELGARDVVDKPDFSRLEQVLSGVVVAIEDAAERARSERRVTRRLVEPAPELPRSLSGVAGVEDLLATAARTVVGDSVLVVALTDPDGKPGLDLGEQLRATLRVQDIVHERPQIDGYVVVLRGGDEHAASGVWKRLVALVDDAARPGRLRGAWSLVDELGLLAAIERAEDVFIAAMRGESGLQPA